MILKRESWEVEGGKERRETISDKFEKIKLLYIWSGIGMIGYNKWVNLQIFSIILEYKYGHCS